MTSPFLVSSDRNFHASSLDEIEELAKVRARFQVAEEIEKPNREAAAEALRFYFGDQWADDIKNARKADGRPCFTLNKLPAIIKQVLNETRANQPAIEVSPVADGADEDTAEALQGLARHVENNSDGATAYETAFTYMVIGGFGSWEIRHDYLPNSFDQDLFIDSLLNPFSVYWGPSKKLDRSDAAYCFVTEDYDPDSFAAEFPDSEIAGRSSFEGVGDLAPGWCSGQSLRVAKYYEVRSETAELVQLTDGRVIWEEDMKRGDRIALGPDKKPITRRDKRRSVWVGVTNGFEWLEKPSQLGADVIPVVTIYGDELFVDGEMRYKGLVADLMEPARLFNYNSSAIAETMALGSRANWIATVEQIEPFMDLWRQSSSRNMAVLPYKSVPGIAPPAKISTEPPIQAMSAARMQSADDLRSISGVYDGTQSPNGGEESGKAILARRWQTSTGQANYTGNLARGIKRTGQILLKFFPVIYDTGRILRITGTDQQAKQIVVHAGRPETVPAEIPEGIQKIFDLSVGTYEVTVNVGPTHETKRKESLDTLLSLVAANPALTPVIGDLIVNEMDFPGKRAIVERLQKALPPALQDNQNPTDPAQLQAHNLQLMQQNQHLMQQVQQITQQLQTKQIESQSRERVEAMKLQSAEVTSGQRLQAEQVKAQAAILTRAADKNFDATHDHAMSDKTHAHALHKMALAPQSQPAEPDFGGGQ